jgi:Sec-independent protein translocase protein TatA
MAEKDLTLVEVLAEQETQKREAAVVEYRALIRRNNNPRPGDAERLTSAMRILGKSADDFKADVAIISEAAESEALADQLDTAAEKAAEAEYDKAVEHLDRVRAEAQAACAVAERRRDAAARLNARAREARYHADYHLKAQHLDLFDDGAEWAEKVYPTRADAANQ